MRDVINHNEEKAMTDWMDDCKVYCPWCVSFGTECTVEPEEYGLDCEYYERRDENDAVEGESGKKDS